MRPRGTGRFALALMALIAVYQLGFTKLLAAAGGVAGGWGIGLALLVGGALAALIFTAVYDGPRALLAPIRPSRRTTGTRAR